MRLNRSVTGVTCSVNPFASASLGGRPGDSTAQTVAHDRRPQNNRSYVTGAKHNPLAFITVSQLLDQACEKNGADDAAIFPEQDIALSWYALRDKADQLAAGLLALGIRRGNRVAIWSPNRVEWLVAQFGTARIGAILVNINPAYRESELEFALNKVRARVLIMARSLKSSDYLSMLKKLAPEINRQPQQDSQELYIERLPALKHIVVLGEGDIPPATIGWQALVSSAGPAHKARLPGLAAALDPDDPINIQFTSGTTGRPKGATLSHFNIVNNARYTAEAMRLTTGDRLCIPVPLYHCFGMVLGVLAAASAGAGMVFPAESFTPESTLNAASQHACTAMLGVPTMFIAMLEQPAFADHDLSSLRTGIMAGASCPVDTMQRVINDMHMDQVTIAYGMTETSPVSFQSNVDDPVHLRVSTVGRIHPHVDVKIVDDRGRIVAPGEQGELCTRGYNVMQGYWGETAQTYPINPIDPAGWMHTGDLATIDSDGYCAIVGRVKDMIIRGGENISPREIEDHLIAHTGIVDAQVFGISDSKFGEVVCAWCIVQPGAALDEDGIKAWCSTSIAHYKVPAHVRIVASFPLTVTGKPRKVEMREQMTRELGLQHG